MNCAMLDAMELDCFPKYFRLRCKAKEKSSGKIGRVVSEPTPEYVRVPNPQDRCLVAGQEQYSVWFAGEQSPRRIKGTELKFLPE